MHQHSLSATKLHIPPFQQELVSRLRLIEHLQAGLHRKLTLVSEPPGFGRFTPVAEWVSHSRFPILDFGSDSGDEKAIQNPGSKNQNRIAWLSLDESDNEVARFLTYFAAALQAAEPGQEAARHRLEFHFLRSRRVS